MNTSKSRTISIILTLTLLLSWVVGCAPARTPTPKPEAPVEVTREVMKTVVVSTPVVEIITPTPVPTPPPVQTKEAEKPAPGQAAARKPPRLRQWFPETLYWNPELITDEEGRLRLLLQLADSITTWRLAVLASSRQGELGVANKGITVFQDFFIDPDLPVYLTQHDEVSIPVGVYNYLPEAQRVEIEITQEPWFELLGAARQEMTIAANDVDVVYFPIRVRDFGRHTLTFTGWGEQMSDAIAKTVTVVPDGKEIRRTTSDWLRGDTTLDVHVPTQAIPGTARVEVKIYPGVVSQIVEGLEKILRMPFG